MALNTHQRITIATVANGQGNPINAALKRAARGVLSAKLVIDVIAFNLFDPKEIRADKALKQKVRC